MPIQRRRGALLLAGIWLATIASFTLVPLPRQLAQAAATPWYCVVCGDRGMVDVLLNVALFVPFGVGLGLLGAKPLRALLAGGLIALAIELLQATLVTGRDPSLSDVLTNGTGTILGAWLGLWLPQLWRPSVALARRLAGAVAAAWLAVVVLSGWGLSPDRAHGNVKLVAAPPARFLEPFAGQIIRSALDTGVRHLSLSADVETAGISDRLSPILDLQDEDAAALARLGQLGQKPAFSYRLHATRARFRTPTVYVYGAVIPPTPARIVIQGGMNEAKLWSAVTVQGTRYRAELALTPGLGWMLLLPLGYPFDLHSAWTSAIWLALPLVLLGFWAGRGGMSAPVTIAAAALLLLLGLEGVAAFFHLARDGVLAWVLGGMAVTCGWWLGVERQGSAVRHPASGS